MNRLLLFFLMSLVVFSCNQTEKKETSNTQTTTKTDSAINTGVPDIAANSLKSGEEITKYSNGVIKTKGVLRNGLRIGQWSSWHENGQLWSENFYENGLRNGKTSSWFDNGKLRYEGYYTNDKKTGKWKFYNEKGVFVKEEDFGN